MRRPGLPGWLTRPMGPRILPLEWIALISLLLLALALARLPVAYNLLLVFKVGFLANAVIFGQIAGILVVLTLLFAGARAGRGERLSDMKGRLLASPFVQAPYWIDAARMVLALTAVLSAHFLVKISIHILNPLVFDAWLWRYDRWLGLGHDPVLLLLALIHQGWLLRAIDYTYSVIYPAAFTLYVPILALASPTRALRVAAVAGFCLLWIAGGLLYVAFPSWGPVYTQPQHFERTLQSMPITVHVQSELFRELKGVIDNPGGQRPVKYGGVAAFPSLHLAVMTLFVLASLKVRKWWGGLNIFLATVMFVGSMVTGYHYLLDSLAGIVMGIACYHGALRWTHRCLGDDPRPLPRPGDASDSPSGDPPMGGGEPSKPLG